LVVISHAEAALTNTAFASSAIRRRAVIDSRRSPSGHHRKACVSSSRRTSALLARFFWRERIEKRARDFCSSTHGAESSPRPDELQTRQAGDRHLPAGNDDLVAPLVTNNTAEFGRVKGLTLENWTLPLRRTRSRVRNSKPAAVRQVN
jgi:hypothetical protein